MPFQDKRDTEEDIRGKLAGDAAAAVEAADVEEEEEEEAGAGAAAAADLVTVKNCLGSVDGSASGTIVGSFGAIFFAEKR